MVIATTWLVTSGSRDLRTSGDVARFSADVLQVLAPLQLALLTFAAAIAAASLVSDEKDRRTLSLLLLTRMSDAEIVVGKWSAAGVRVLTLFVAGMPVFAALTLLGGVSWEQLGRIWLVTLAAMLTAACLGGTIAFWRDKSYQTFALVMLTLVGWTAGWEAAAIGWGDWTLGTTEVKLLAAAYSPASALAAAMVATPTEALALGWFSHVVWAHVAVSAAAAMMLTSLSIFRMRAWNTTREPLRTSRAEQDSLVGRPRETDKRVAARLADRYGRSRAVQVQPV